MCYPQISYTLYHTDYFNPKYQKIYSKQTCSKLCEDVERVFETTLTEKIECIKIAYRVQTIFLLLRNFVRHVLHM